MGNTSGAVLQAGINRAIQSASTYLNPDTRDAILGPALSRYAKGGTGKTLMELACHADGLRVVFDTLLADGKITNSEIEVCKEYLALTAAHFAKVRTQYAGFATLVGSDIGPFLKLYRDDTGAFGYRDSSTKWSGIQACMNIGKNHGDGTALNILRDTLLQAAKTLLMADGVEDKELDYLKKLSAEIGSNSTSGATKPGSSQSATPLQKVIDADFECWEKSSNTEDWLDENISNLKFWQQAAQGNDPKAQVILGFCHQYGKGVEEDKEESVRWFRLAAEQGVAQAQNNLGICYVNGEGVEEDKEEAVRWFRLAAEQGDADAQYNLGVYYEKGEGVEEDKEEAARWFRLAAEQGDAQAQNNLGVYYEKGEGVEEDKEEAFRWFKLAAEQGHAQAQFNLGVYYEKGEGVEEDKEEAVRWYRLAADQGLADAQYILGRRYDDGEGVEEDKEEAVRWYRLAADQGHGGAQCCLGVCCANGEGVEKDMEEAVRWFRLAADQEHAPGQYFLGISYFYGNGVEENKEEGTKWIQMAADGGWSKAQEFLDNATEDEDEYEDDDSGNAGSQLWPVHSVRFSESELVDPPGTVINSLGMKFVPIKPGKFMMGGREDEEGYNEEEELLHAVQITKPFLLGMFAVTQSDYVKVMGANPSIFHGKTRPVEHVTWKQAVDFCKRLSELPAEKAAKRVYRLPTEAEWEYACRAGTETAFAFGDELTQLQANFCQENVSVPQPTLPVGMYPPNAWGLFDMHGNVWEWCSDWYGLDYYSTSPAMDPKGPAKGTHHVLKGGSASLEKSYCRSAVRGESMHDGPFPNMNNRLEFIGDLGLRVVCEFRQ